MRDAFIAELHEIAAKDPAVLLLSGDIGFKVFDRFRDTYPGRYMNMGVAEANMVGVSAGLALSGKRPVAYTIVPFLTMRAFEQIRVDVAMQHQPVMIVGVGGGLAYDILGPTHHSIEDVSLMRSLPGMTVLTPADPNQVRAATRAAYDLAGPVYIRLGKNGEPDLGTGDHPFEIGRPTLMRGGDDAVIIASGAILSVAIDAAAKLGDDRISCSVVNLHSVKPIDAGTLLDWIGDKRAIVTLEEHSIIGGTGSAVAEIVAEAGLGVPLKRLGIRDRFTFEVGSREWLLNRHGLDAQSVADAVKSLIA
ncbi:MAG: transketolase C-terminal domain-containing protein [Rhodospirillales bacterium]